jgi:hypothetical protein
MKNIALHILDIAQNSISAGASLINIELRDSPRQDELVVKISDNGKGMDQEAVNRVADPFYTTRTTRKVGMGIPLLKHNAEQAGGRLTLSSVPCAGTKLKATFSRSHPDCPPLGDVAGVISLLSGANPAIDFVYRHTSGTADYVFDTREVKLILEEVPLSEPSVIRYIKEMINENLRELEAPETIIKIM